MNENYFLSENLIFKFLQVTGLLYAFISLPIMILMYVFGSGLVSYNSLMINILFFRLGGLFEILLFSTVFSRRTIKKNEDR
jgi:hypothetical protein